MASSAIASQVVDALRCEQRQGTWDGPAVDLETGPISGDLHRRLKAEATGFVAAKRALEEHFQERGRQAWCAHWTLRVDRVPESS